MVSRRIVVPVVSLVVSAVVVVLAMRPSEEPVASRARTDVSSPDAGDTCPPGFRTFTVTNQASQTVWLGQTAGAAPPPHTCTTDSDCGPNQACQNPTCATTGDCDSGNLCDTNTGQCMVAPGTGCVGGAPIITVPLSTMLCTGAKQVPTCNDCGPEGCDTTTGLCKCAQGGQAACPTGTTCADTVQECGTANGGTCYFQQVVPGEDTACVDTGSPCPTGQSCNVALGLCQYPRTDGGVPYDALELTPQETATLCMPSTLPPAFAQRLPEYAPCTEDSQCQSSRCLVGSGQVIPNPPTDCAASDAGACVCRPVVGWSGSFFGRLGCDEGGTNCRSADCGNVPGLPCALGKGGTNPFSSAEFTLQPNASDFYDVTVINGANVSIQMGPLADAGLAPAPIPSPYYCGTAGSRQVQGNVTVGMLEACSWRFAPDTTSGLPADFTTLLRAVALPVCSQSSDCASGATCVGNQCVPTLTACNATAPYCANGQVCSNPNAPDAGACGTCRTDSDCASDAGTQVCGTAFLPGVGDKTPLLQTCGQPIGWWSYEDLCAANPAYSYGPLDCTQQLTVQTGPTTSVTDSLSNLFQCANQFGQSCYNATAGDSPACCGCATYPGNDAGVFWPTTLQAGNNPGQQDAGECIDNNPVWAQNVQPWLAFLKRACPTAYTYAYDDATSTFTCMSPGTGADAGTPNAVGYSLVFGDVN
ncbi:hypothetical protein LY474_30815 [Myxococcus stipitatus]|uniref:thaumatin family protein n=1 Tax=Myxococcus stipitatus TaxID=83455 RepID=UPI001F2677F4|nr:thaumatin family protein [Myxococcus stipitatus]MCE9672206.1 hypothetical protein [Myxococcus stipitatus]